MSDKVFKTKAGYRDSSFYNKLFFNWIQPFINRSHTSEKLISFEDCGSLGENEMLPIQLNIFRSKYAETKS